MLEANWVAIKKRKEMRGKKVTFSLIMFLEEVEVKIIAVWMEAIWDL